MVQPISRNPWSAPSTLPKAGAKTGQHPIARRRARRQPVRVTLSMVEGAVLCLVVALFLVYAGTAIGEHVTRPTHPPVISVTIQPGDTLWTLAAKYGAPNDYILRRVDRLAAYNHLPAGKHLQPGQVIEVPVENPAYLNN